MNSVLLISDAAKKVRVEAHVLRYWEEELGLPIKRNELGHRYYTEEDVKRFQEIKDLKEKGLQLKAIRMVLKNGKFNMLSPGETFLPSMTAEEKKAGQMQETGETEKLKLEEIETSQEAELQVTGATEHALQSETNAEKMQRLQWLLQQLFKDTLRENNEYLCREMKEGVLKELDYQFRMLEEREEERNTEKVKRDEEHYRKIDDLLRKKRKLPNK